jgi:hypothetical protein
MWHVLSFNDRITNVCQISRKCKDYAVFNSFLTRQIEPPENKVIAGFFFNFEPL